MNEHVKKDPSGLWAGGGSQCLKALRQEEREKIRPLRELLSSEANCEVRRGLKEKIKAIRMEFKRKRKAAETSLFGEA